MQIFEREKVDLAILDLNLSGGGSGLDLLGKMRDLDPEVMGIIVTAYASVESAVEALRKGAYDYITKPFANDHLKAVVRKALAQKALFHENRFLRRELREKYRFESIIGNCDAIEQVFRMMEKVARTDSSVLITGESGTGKELVARAIHFSSERANKRFLPINCGALPENLLESELFGYKRGAFTGATQDKIGLLKAADKGTIFSTKSATCRSRCRSNCCARCRSANAIRSAPTNRSVSTSACFARPTKTSSKEVQRRPLPRGAALSHQRHHYSVCRRCASAKTISPLLANHFLRKYEKPLGRSAMRFSKGAMRLLMSYAGRATCANSKTRSSALRFSPRPTSSTLTTCPKSCTMRYRPMATSFETSGNDAGRTRARAYAPRA